MVVVVVEVVTMWGRSRLPCELKVVPQANVELRHVDIRVTEGLCSQRLSLTGAGSDETN